MQRKTKSKKIKNALNMIARVYSRRYRSYRMYLKGDSPHQAVMIVYELKWFSHISNRHNMYTLMQSCDVFHTQHVIFFAILDTCAGTMWFGYHKILLLALFKLPMQSGTHFTRSLSWYFSDFTPKLSHLTPLTVPQGFFKLFQVFLHLVSI